MDSLPNELLVRIFEYLDYADLKFSIPRVSKLFHEIVSIKTKYGIIDKALFRDFPASDGSTVTKHQYEPHPAFRRIIYRLQPEVEAVRLWQLRQSMPGESEPWPWPKPRLFKTPVALENAVSPAVRKMKICIPRIDPDWSADNIDDKLFEIFELSSDSTGITVLDVMKSIVVFLGEFIAHGVRRNSRYLARAMWTCTIDWTGVQDVRVGKDGI